jgi:Tfp pilus assembly protein PilV
MIANHGGRNRSWAYSKYRANQYTYRQAHAVVTQRDSSTTTSPTGPIVSAAQSEGKAHTCPSSPAEISDISTRLAGRSKKI